MADPRSKKAYRPEGYTEADQRSDTSFLVGVRFGREQERAALLSFYTRWFGVGWPDPEDIAALHDDLATLVLSPDRSTTKETSDG